MGALGAVRQVEPGDVHTAFDKPLYNSRRAGGRANCAYYFSSPFQKSGLFHSDCFLYFLIFLVSMYHLRAQFRTGRSHYPILTYQALLILGSTRREYVSNQRGFLRGVWAISRFSSPTMGHLLPSKNTQSMVKEMTF
jgi:hypothetical protein